MLAFAAVAMSACGFGTQSVSVPADQETAHEGAELFSTHCAACHTMEPAGTQGTGNRASRTQGPNLDQRQVSVDDALFAIQNGGFSGAIMPQNIVVGDEAEAVAEFVGEYSGSEAGEEDDSGGTDTP